MIKVNEMAAVGKENGDVLGFLTWYSVSEQLISRDELAKKLAQAGIDRRFMPQEIRLPDAFRRATSAVERKREPGHRKGVVENYLIREVSSDNKHILRYVVRETRDSKGKRLDYEPKVGSIHLDKTTGLVKSDSLPGIPEEICKEAERLYNVFQVHYDSRSIRSMIYKILTTFAPIPVRPSGGVYFVPNQFRNELQNLVYFLKLLEGHSEGWSIPLINISENKDMVRRKISEHIKQTVESLAVALRDSELSRSKGNSLLDDAKSIIDNFSLYKETLSEELEDMNLMVDIVKKQMLAMVERLSA